MFVIALSRGDYIDKECMGGEPQLQNMRLKTEKHHFIKSNRSLAIACQQHAKKTKKAQADKSFYKEVSN
jgi:predicted double-glycine peptidase